MRTALWVGDDENPLKATIESVLPGVHEQFVNLHHEIGRVQSSVEKLMGQRDGQVTGNFLFSFFPLVIIDSKELTTFVVH